MRDGGASSSCGVSSPGSTARALEAAEERLREALADGLARVSFKINWFIFNLIIIFLFILLILTCFAARGA